MSNYSAILQTLLQLYWEFIISLCCGCLCLCVLFPFKRCISTKCANNFILYLIDICFHISTLCLLQYLFPWWKDKNLQLGEMGRKTSQINQQNKNLEKQSYKNFLHCSFIMFVYEISLFKCEPNLANLNSAFALFLS